MKKKIKLRKSAAFEEKSIHNSAKNFFLKYKGFTFALIATIVIIIAFLFVNFDIDLAQEKANYAKEMHENNMDLFIGYESAIGEISAIEETNTLNDDYTASMKDDVLWLKEKENNIYNSTPRSEVFSKEVAITMLTQAIMQVNSDYAMETGQIDYDDKIKESLMLEVKELKLLTAEEITATFPTVLDKQIYLDNLNLLWKEYFDSKQSIIKITASKERKYVEARKLIWMTEYYLE